MKKVFAMFAAVLFFGAMMVSCNKDDNKTDDKQLTKADMVGTWEGTYDGTATINNANEKYTIKWTLELNPEGSNTIGSLKYHTTFQTLEDLNGVAPVTDFYVRDNTNTGRIVITGGPALGFLDAMFDFDMDASAKSMKGVMEVHCVFGADDVTLGGGTTLNKK